MGALRIAFALALLGCGNPWLPSACDDGLDNDGDGRVDLEDPDCADRGSDSERPDLERPDAGMDAQVPIDAAPPPDARIDAPIDLDAGPDAGDAGRDDDAGGECTLTPASWTCPGQARPERCGGACVDLETDPAHCGACDRACPAGESCRHGTCWPCAAGGGEVCADGLCVGAGRSPRSCGGCGGAVCRERQACVAGACEAAGPREGDQCNRPLSVALGAQTVRVFASAALDAAWPRCATPDRVPQRGAILSVRAPSDGTYVLSASSVGIGLGLQRLSDTACRCADPAADACAVGVTDVSLEVSLSGGVDALYLLVTDEMSVAAVDVTFSPR